MWVTSSTANVLKPTAIALGNFDGIHRGHQQVLQPILKSDEGASSEKRHATVVTFDPHPRQFFTGHSRKLLTPVSEKVTRLEQLGVEQLVLLPFNQELAALSPPEFVQILVEQLQATLISVGEDFRFGRKRVGTAADLKAIAAPFGINVYITSLHTCRSSGETVRISSSLIRQALEQGDISTATQMLGRAYTLTGTVVVGQKLGRTIGFPTANLQLPPEKFLPRYGVYCVKVSSANCEHGQALSHSSSVTSSSIGVMNLGCRPTVSGTTPTAEVHVLDWSGDLYGQTLTVSLEQFLRPEQKFASLQALKSQIAEDCERARGILSQV